MLINHATSIGRLRVRSDTRDSLLTRIRLERMLSGVDWRPTALPVNAILCIRKAYDPLPHSFSLSASSLQPGHEWQQALTSMLNRFTSQAVRPLTNFVPPNSKAVVFLDHAELLACLAVDCCRGSLTTNWWWRGILGDRDLTSVVKLWNDKPQYVPAALHHLAMIKFAVPFVAKLSDATSRQLGLAVAHDFGAAALWQLLDVAVARASLPESVISTEHDQRLPATQSRDIAENPPWRALVPETRDAILSLEQQRFLGIGLTIYRAPSLARSRDFVQQLARWQSGVDEERRSFSTRSSTETSSPHDMARPSQPGAEARVSSPLVTRDIKREQAGEQSTTESIGAQLVLPLDLPSKAIITPPQPEPLSSRSEAEVQFAISETSSLAAELPQSAPVPATTPDSEPFERPVLDFETQLGGLFYLINLGIYLNLYADFTAPLTPGIDLNIWDFVALVGRELLEDAEDNSTKPSTDYADLRNLRMALSFPDDPIWAALTNLAGRDESQTPSTKFEPDEKTRSWLSELMPDVRARLRLALGLQTNDEIPAILCQHYARVRATDTHVDAYFSLANLPLAIRFAGLDRDPGWVPAAGRFISFHFD